MIKILTGNEAAAYGALLAKPAIVCAYPITPQTRIPEQISEFKAQGLFKGKFVNVESEMTALGYVIGASTSGVRTFTATSSQGLAWMHEGLHWASGSRLPIVMANVNRPLAAPWNLTCGQIDSLSQRDTGWIQYYCESNQEVLDTIIQAYKVAESACLPAMVCLDGVYLSYLSESVSIPEQEIVDKYLPPYDPTIRNRMGERVLNRHKTQPSEKGLYATFNFTGNRYELHKLALKSLQVASDANEEFKHTFGRSYPLVEEYKCDDAEVVLVTVGSAVGTGRYVVDAVRAQGHLVGLVKLKIFRPFPKELVRKALGSRKKIVVIERDISPGQCGIFCQEIMWALYNNIPIYGFVGGLGGEDITTNLIEKAIMYAIKNEPPPQVPIWLGLEEKSVSDVYDRSAIKIY